MRRNPSPQMVALRQRAKRITQVLGIHPFIRDTKEALHWKIENWQWPLFRQLQRLLKISHAEVEKLSAEYDAAGVWKTIYSRVTSEVTSDPSYWHGTSSEQDLRRLYILARVLKPRIVIETGVASGASAFLFLTALEKNGAGELYSIDLPPDQWAAQIPDYRKLDKVTLPAQKSPGWLVPENLKSRWHFIAGDSRIELPGLLQQVGSCDLFYHDAEHTYEAMIWEYRTVWPSLRPGGILASDDVEWSNAFSEFAAKTPDVENPCVWRGFGMMRKAAPRP